MKLIKDYVKRFHECNLPSPEKCLKIESGDMKYISDWIENGQIKGKAKDMFEWIEMRYFTNSLKNIEIDASIQDEIRKRFFLKNWRKIILFSEYQMKYRYYSKVIEQIKEKTKLKMSQEEFLDIFEK